MHLLGTYEGYQTASDGSTCILLAVDKSEITEQLENTIGEKIAIDIERLYGKRTVTANSYMWVLLTKMAQILRVTKEEMYLRELREYGVYEDISVVKQGVKTLQKYFRLVEPFEEWNYDNIDDTEMVTVRAYIGSSHFDRLQMARMLDGIKADCELMGIDTWDPEEVQRLISMWEPGENKYES